MQITEHIHALKIPFHIQVAPEKRIERFVYVYFISNGTTVLIDTGVAASSRLILEYLDRITNERQSITLTLLTHAHPDHIGSAKTIKAVTNCMLAAHPKARTWIEDVDRQYKDRPVPGFYELVEGSVSIDRALQNGEYLDCGDNRLRVLYTPGHSSCSLSLFHEKSGALWVGDAVPQWHDLPIYEDVVTSVQSIKKLQRIKGIKYLFASWSDPVKGDDAYGVIDEGLRYLQHIHNLVLKIDDKEVLGQPMELCKKIVPQLGLPEFAVNPLVARSLASHLKIVDCKDLLTDC